MPVSVTNNPLTTLSVDALKLIYIDESKCSTNNLLSETDWYLIRKAETNKPIPQDVQDRRASIRSSCDAYEISVNACQTVDELQALGRFNP